VLVNGRPLPFIKNIFTYSVLSTIYGRINGLAVIKKENRMYVARNLNDQLQISDLPFSKEEALILEAELFIRICDEFKSQIKSENKNYFRLLKINTEEEKSMIETNFIRCLITDILATEEYTLPGLAYYTNTPEEIIYDVASGKNTNPTFLLSQKIIDIHRTVRPQLYNIVVNKLKMYCANEDNHVSTGCHL